MWPRRCASCARMRWMWPAAWNQSLERKITAACASLFRKCAAAGRSSGGKLKIERQKMSSILQSSVTATGRFGPYGGRYVPETLMVPLFEVERAYEAAKSDAAFQSRFHDLLQPFAGVPPPLQFASRLSDKLGGPRIY